MTIALLGSVQMAFAETWEVQGKVYSNVRVLGATPGTVTIFHSGGLVQLDLSDLPPELQERFDFDPEQAEKWSEQANVSLAETREAVEIKRRERLGAPASIDKTPVEEKTNESKEAADFVSLSESQQVVLRKEVDFRLDFRRRVAYADIEQLPLLFEYQNSCVYAIVGALEFEVLKETGSNEPLADQFVLWAVRTMFPEAPVRGEAIFEQVFTALGKYGVPEFRSCELVPLSGEGWIGAPRRLESSIDGVRPTEESIAAAMYKDVKPVWISPEDPRLIDSLVALLNAKIPVVVGVAWPHRNSLKTNNLLRDQTPISIAGHAVVLVGYRNPGRKPGQTTFIFRNSHGPNWGIGGFGLMEERYLKQYLFAALYLRLP